MNQFIEQLAARNLDESPQMLRPRLGSRFESIRPVQHDALLESVQSIQQPDSVPQFDYQGQAARDSNPSPSNSNAEESTQFPTLPSPIVQQNVYTEVRQSEQADLNPKRNGDNRLESLADRLDQLDARIGSVHRETLDLPNPIATNKEPRRTELNPNITHYNQITNVLQSPTVGAERNLPLPVDGQAGTANNPVPKPIVEPAKPKTSPSQPIPSIIVEADRNRTSEQKHTVTVTIGRIEVRAPQQPAATTPRQAEKSAARIMSLDEYVKRRAGGAG